jgi:Family of unknown function (DUF6489)
MPCYPPISDSAKGKSPALKPTTPGQAAIAKVKIMKVTVDIDCTPEEARKFLGLPDVAPANEIYVDNLSKLMQGAKSVDQMQQMAEQFAPLGKMGLKLFQDIAAAATAASATNKPKKDA